MTLACVLLAAAPLLAAVAAVLWLGFAAGHVDEPSGGAGEAG